MIPYLVESLILLALWTLSLVLATLMWAACCYGYDLLRSLGRRGARTPKRVTRPAWRQRPAPRSRPEIVPCENLLERLGRRLPATSEVGREPVGKTLACRRPSTIVQGERIALELQGEAVKKAVER